MSWRAQELSSVAFVHIAVAPSTAPTWMADAVLAGGGVLVDADSAEGVVWGDAREVGQLAALLDRNPAIRWVQLPFAGVENFIHLVDDERLWTCGKGVYADPVAEHALGLALAGFRHLVDYARAKSWAGPAGRNLIGSRVTILGGGGITQSLVRLLAPFGCSITVVRRTVVPMVGVDKVTGLDQLNESLRGADLVFVALALTPETRGVLSEPQFRLMEDHAWVVNVGRGGHIITDDLVSALREGQIAGAALDVIEPEPLPSDHPLWSLPNCLITPHVGNTPEMAVPLLSERITRNVQLVTHGEPPLGRIDPAVGY